VKNITAFILLLAFSGSTLYNALAVADYFLRYDYYKTVLCEKRADTSNSCHGTCQLNNDLADEESPNPKIPEITRFEFTAQLSENLKSLEPFDLSRVSKKTSTQIQFPISNKSTAGVFHPPQIVSLS
jgi:hypothetical protein